MQPYRKILSVPLFPVKESRLRFMIADKKACLWHCQKKVLK
jgi:hypothetical protein